MMDSPDAFDGNLAVALWEFQRAIAELERWQRRFPEATTVGDRGLEALES